MVKRIRKSRFNLRRRSYKPKRTRKRVARRRRSSRRRSITRFVSRGRGRARSIGGGIVSTVKPMAAGIGMGLIAENIAGRVAPQASMIAGYGGAYLGGGVKGVIGKVIYDSVLGGGGLGNLFGGGGSSGGGAL